MPNANDFLWKDIETDTRRVARPLWLLTFSVLAGVIAYIVML